MSARPVDELLASLAARGVELWCEGDRLRFHAPKGALDAVHRERVARLRPEIMSTLRTAATEASAQLPVSFPQFAMWFQHQQAPTSTVCTVGLVLHASGPIDLRCLRHAVRALVDRHPMLRTTYHVCGGALVQRIAGAAQATLEIEPHAASDAMSGALPTKIATQMARPFNLETGPLFRAVLYTDGAAEHTLLLTVHHIAADGWACRILISELLSLYGEAAENRAPELARPPAYEEFVRAQAALVDGAEGERQWDYWRHALAPPRQRTRLPTDVVRPAVPRFVGDALRLNLSADAVQRVLTLVARLRTTPFVVLLGAFQLLLAKLCGVRDVVTGTPVLGRAKAEYLSVVGNFMNVLPVRSRLEENATVSEFLAALHSTVVAALEAQDYPLLRMVQKLHLSGEETGQALFNTSFTVLTPDPEGVDDGRSVAGTRFVLQPLALQAGLLDLGMDIVASDTSMHCILKYSLDVLTAAAAARIAEQYAAMIDALTGAPDQALSALLGTPHAAASDDARAASLIDSLAARDVTLAVEGERLRINAPKGALDETARRVIAEQRTAIIARLRAAAERADPDFWRGQLEGAPTVLALPLDRPRREQVGGARQPLAELVCGVPPALLARLRAIGEARDATLFTTLMAAWQVLLHRYSGQDDIVVATAAATAHLSPSSVIPIRGRLGGNPTFDRFLEQIRRTLLAAAEHRVPPGQQHQVRFDMHASATAAPDYLVARGRALDAQDRDLDVQDRALDGREDCPELALLITTDAPSAPGEPRFRYRFASELFDEPTILRLHENFHTLLESIAAAPAATVQALDLLGATERRRVLQDSGADALTAHDRDLCLHQVLERSARLNPARIAVSGVGGDLSYAVLDTKANRLAQFLLRKGQRRGALVAVCMQRTVAMLQVLAAVLKAGAAYLPLDPAHPPERLRGILRDSRADVLITETGFENIAEGTAAEVIRLDADAAAIAACPDAPTGVTVDPEDLAYVIYTSGSTGRPKGVEVEHRNVVAFLEAMRRRPGLGETDVLLAVTTIAFDIAGLEFWLPLSVGARVVLATRAEAVDGARLAALLDVHAVSVMQATPATWRLLLDSGWTGRQSLRALCGGEALPQPLAARLIGCVGELWNLYGPTETTIWSTAGRVSAASARALATPIPIGRPITNTLVRIEDGAGKTVPAGVVGDLLIGGEGVARGYRDRPELTAQSFITRSDGRATSRFYRTGDLARFRSDGELEFFGRRDYQIKLRGHRIEPGEIEALLAGQAGIMASVVIAQATTPEDERLLAYLTLAPGATLDPDALRTALRAQLPDYMVPSQFVVLPALPLTPNGKVDRKALPLPEVVPTAALTGAASIPTVALTPAQHRVVALWKDVLRVGRVGLNDNFFDIGGHSLLLVKIHAGLKREFGCELPLVELFQHTTVAQQAQALERMSHA